jgi:hypothetical protein
MNFTIALDPRIREDDGTTKFSILDSHIIVAPLNRQAQMLGTSKADAQTLPVYGHDSSSRNFFFHFLRALRIFVVKR